MRTRTIVATVIAVVGLAAWVSRSAIAVWQTARKVYANAKYARDYATWTLAAVLEARIAEARENVSAFNNPQGTAARPIMIESSFACMACHQQ